MNLKARMSLAITALVVVLIGVAALIQARFVQATLKQTIADQQFSMVSRVADEIDNRFLLNQSALARVAAGITPALIADPAALQVYLDDKRGMLALFDDLLVVSPALVILADAPRFPGRRGANVAQLAHLQRAFKTREVQVSSPYLGVVTKRPTLTLVMPIFAPDGTMIGVLNGQQNLLAFNFLGALAERKVGKSGDFVVTTAQRQTIVSHVKERILQSAAAPGADPLYDRALTGWEGSDEGVTSHGRRMLMSFKTLKSTGWVIGALLPVDEAYAPINDSRLSAWGLLGGASLLVALIVWLSMRRILAPLLELRQNMRRLRDAPELVHSLVAGDDEIGAVAGDFYRLFDELAQARRESSARAEQLQSILDASPLAVVVVADRCLLSANRGFERLFGYRFAEVAGQSIERCYLDAQAYTEFGRRLYAALAGGAVATLEIQFRDRAGRVFWADCYARLLDAQAPGKGAVVMIHDITARRQAEEQLRLSATVIEGSSEGILITDRDTCILSVNPAFCRITGYAEAEVLGRTPSVFKSDRHDADFYHAMWASILTLGSWQGEIWNRARDGRVFPEWLMISVVRDEQGAVTHYIGIFTDISERKANEARIRHIAEHDALTSLPNRVLLNDRLGDAIVKAQRAYRKIALLVLDLDRFKNINDSLGHQVGDQLLQSVAERILRVVHASDTVSRPGGDEFMLLLSEITCADDAARVAERLLAVLARPYLIKGHELVVTASIGISIYPDDGTDMQTLIRSADTAMYHSKESGRDAYHFFTPEMNVRVFERMSLEHSLRHALEHNEFLLHYQPQIDIDSRRIIGMEALVRWQHPLEGLVPPAKFIPVAEDCGLILALGAWVLKEACRQNQAWQEQGLPALPVAVNISALQFRQKLFAETVDQALAASGLPPDCLELELTESVMMHAAERNIELLQAIRHVGVKVSIDDFGTGYSSLSYLKRLPIDKLKIDQAFVRDIATNADDAAIIDTIIGLARNMKLKVIAEGVETQAQLDFLQRSGCPEIQGYFFSRPLPPDEFETLWRASLAS
jgi:diguanylate cyclase (GGDEF)-like protein/PAS domain S-box-containing protein